MATTTLKVVGMSCGHCVAAVTTALQGLRGVQDAKVDLQSGRAVVAYDPEQVNLHQLVHAVEEEGYTAEAS